MIICSGNCSNKEYTKYFEYVNEDLCPNCRHFESWTEDYGPECDCKHFDELSYDTDEECYVCPKFIEDYKEEDF